MINLIPNEERKKMIKDLYFRFVVVAFFAIGTSVLAASISLLPSYFFSSIKADLANTKLDTQKKEPAPVVEQTTLGVVKDLNGKISLIERAQKNKYLVSNRFISEILTQKMSDIKITEMSYESNTEKGKLIIKGTAPSRNRLLSFRKKLEEDRNFSKVDLPISNFIKDSDIQFSITLIPS